MDKLRQKYRFISASHKRKFFEVDSIERQEQYKLHLKNRLHFHYFIVHLQSTYVYTNRLKMKIAFDAKRITHNGTGLGNYGRYVINGLSSFFPENTYQLYTPGKGKDSLRDRITPAEMVSFHYPESRFAKIVPASWRSFGITSTLKQEKVDLYHGLSNELPMNLKKNGIYSVVTIHDLIFLRYPQYYKLADRIIYTHKFKQACLRADKVIAISKQTKRDIVSFFHIPEDKIEIIYQGCDPIFGLPVQESVRQAVREKYQITSPYILYVGSIEERKNLLLLTKALKQLKEDITLIAIGKRTPYTEVVETYVRENNLSDRVHLLSNIPFSELPAFYQMASLFVYPSFFEGFGIPILEAQLSKIPVIAATGSCLEEAGGGGALYTNPNDEHELGGLIEAVLNEPQLADSMRKSGTEYTRNFDAKKLATDMINLYEQIIF